VKIPISFGRMLVIRLSLILTEEGNRRLASHECLSESCAPDLAGGAAADGLFIPLA